jgi:hypothetical protein
MEHKKVNQKEYSTCLEDFPFAEAMQNTKSHPVAGSTDGRIQDGRTGPPAEKKPRTAGNAVLESIMNLHRCADCPIRRAAIRKPHSVFGKIHNGHMTWWPGWKIYQAELRDRGIEAAMENNTRGEKP